MLFTFFLELDGEVHLPNEAEPELDKSNERSHQKSGAGSAWDPTSTRAVA